MTQLSTETVWMQLSSDLRRFIRRRVPDDHVAEDLLQDIFLRIHRSLDTLHDRGRLAAWVHQIARNALRDHYRRVATSESFPLEEVEDNLDGPPEQGRCQPGLWLSELIGQLPEHYREAITLAEVEGLTQREVADRLGISLSGAKSRIQRGRSLLRDVLDQCCVFQFDHAGRVMDCDPRSEKTGCRKCDGP